MPHGADGLRRLPWFAGELRRRRPDVFHAHLTWPLGAKNAMLAAILARRPAVIATAHLFLDVEITRAMRLQERLIGMAADRLLVVSRDTGRRMHRALGWPLSKMEVIRNAVDAHAVQRPPDPALRRALSGDGDAPLVLVIARLDVQKGHRYVLAAAAQVPGAVLVVAGDGPERAGLEALAGELGIADRVRFLGWRDDVPELLAVSDLVVLPSLYEGLPVSVLEAMAAGRAVVATAVGGTDEAVEDGESGLLVRPRDADGLAAAIRRLLQDNGLRDRLAAAGRARVERDFSAAAMVARITDVYDLLADSRPVMVKADVERG
jgi:glycosyltransferase involved in cell wall biosynthesis